MAAEFGVPEADAARRIAEARETLYAARARRVPPGKDDKILASWNGLMIGAMAEGARVLGAGRWLEVAERAADFILATMTTADGRLLHSYRAGVAHLNGYLEDYAFVGGGLLDLYEAGGSERWLREARMLAERMVADFAADDDGFFSTSTGHEQLLLRPREGHDGAVPSANAAAAHLLARLAAHDGRGDWRDAAERAVLAWGAPMAREPRAFASSLLALDFVRSGPVELAFIGTADAPRLAMLRREAARPFLPRRIIAHHDPAEGDSRLPLLVNKGLVDGQPALYVCRDYACQQPVTDPAGVREALERLEG